MRKLLFILCFMTLATPLRAQTLARAEVTATVRMPEFLSMRVSEGTAVTTTSRRVTVYVTANRAWQLSVVHACTEPCTVRVISEGREHQEHVIGTTGNEIPVLIEYEWEAGRPAPSPTDLQYVLTPA